VDDIVERLRDTAYETDVCWEAAAEIERLRKEVDIKGIRLDDALDEIELLHEARIHLRKLLDEFVDLCTEEQHSVEMLCLHRAAMKHDPWEEARRG
jgi:hypothetical protein